MQSFCILCRVSSFLVSIRCKGALAELTISNCEVGVTGNVTVFKNKLRQLPERHLSIFAGRRTLDRKCKKKY
jgi:hypothetical protein